MKKVTGIGGIFFKCKDVQQTKQWYMKHLGLDVDSYGCTFWQEPSSLEKSVSQQWSPFEQNSTYFGKSDQEFMINYKVHDLDALMVELTKEGVEIAGEKESFDYGDFAWIVDCDGRRVELWQPKNEDLLKSD